MICYVEQPLHHWDEANLAMMYDLPDMLLQSDCHYFIEEFLHLCSLKRLACNSLFLLCPSLVLG
jgi:hypothetical protein